MMDKKISDTKCSLEVTLAWFISVKNLLLNYYGYSPNQLNQSIQTSRRRYRMNHIPCK